MEQTTNEVESREDTHEETAQKVEGQEAAHGEAGKVVKKETKADPSPSVSALKGTVHRCSAPVLDSQGAI